MPSVDENHSSGLIGIKGLIVRVLGLVLLLGFYFWALRTPDPVDDGLIFSALMIYSLWFAYRYTTPILDKYLAEKTLKQDNAQNFMVLWRYAWFAIGLVFVGISFSGSFAALGVSAALLGMVLGWSLQAPVTGVAAWLMIIIRRPFKLGDRVTISGMTGDVVDITLIHTILRQVGGAGAGEELSGRIAMIPNMILFQQIIVNQTRESPYNLDEVQVLISYRSNLTAAQELLLKAAREATGEIIQNTDMEPFVRVELADKGITMRLRYQTLVRERQRIASDISSAIIREIADPSAPVELSNAPKRILNPPP